MSIQQEIKSFASDLKYDMMRSGEWNETEWVRQIIDELKSIGYTPEMISELIEVVEKDLSS